MITRKFLEDRGYTYNHSDKDGRSYETYIKQPANLELDRPWGKVVSMSIKYYSNWDDAFAVEVELENKRYYTLFDGFIENESEFHILMKMLGLSE